MYAMSTLDNGNPYRPWSEQTDEGWRADREHADNPEALYDADEVGEEEPFGDAFQRFADAAEFVNALYPDQMDLNEAREAFAESTADNEPDER
jgi:hypothetical protein